MPRFLLSVLSAILLVSAPSLVSSYEEYEILQLEDPLDFSSTTTTHAIPMESLDDYDIRDIRDIRPVQREFEVLSFAGELGEESESMQFGGLFESPYASSLGSFGSFNSPLQYASPSYGSSLFGFESAGGASSKKRLPTLHLQAAPLMAPSVEISPVTSYVVREQPIKAPRTVIQPIIHQRLVEQPITKTRIVTQPVIRRLITQPIIQPHLIKTTQVQQKIIDQPITVPKVTRQDIVKQVLVEQPMTNKAITRPTIVERRQPKLSVQFMGKNTARPLSRLEALQAAHPLEQGNFKANWNLQNEQQYGNVNQYQFANEQEMGMGGLGQNWAMF